MVNFLAHLKKLSYPEKIINFFFTLLVIDVDYIGPFLNGLAKKNGFCWYVKPVKI